MRDAIACMWGRYQHHCPDHDFRESAYKKFQACMWQMQVTLALEKFAALLSVKPTGPDARLDGEGQAVLVEATSVGPGSASDAVPDPPLNRTYRPDDEGIIKRLRQALKEKVTQHGRWVAAGTVKRDEPLIVAVSAGEIRMAVDLPPTGLTHMEQAVFAIGDGGWQVTVNEGGSKRPFEVGEFFYEYRGSVAKRSGNLVSTDVFLTDECASIRAVLYSPHSFINSHTMGGQDFRFIHNPSATNPLKRGLLKAGTEVWVDGNALAFERWGAMKTLGPHST